MKKCLCFCRVSSKRQDFTAQANKVKAVAMADGYKESEIITVEGKESAIKLAEEERQTLNEMKELIEENPSIESVYVFAIDRLARRVSVILSVKDYLLAKGINLVFLNPHKMGTIRIDEKGNKVEDEMTKLLLMLLSYGAEMEMKIKTERLITKKEEMKSNNEVTGKLIFGYINVNKKPTIDTENTAPIVKWIFRAYNYEGMSLTKIFDKGVEMGYWNNLPVRSSKCSKIRQILMNYSYCGEPTKSGFVYPAIVEKEDIDKAIENMKKAVNKPKTISNVISLAKGKIRDAKTNYMLKYDGNHLKYVHKDDEANGLISASLNIVDFCVWESAKQIKFFLAKHEEVENKTKIEKEINEINTRVENLQSLVDVEIADKFNKLYKAYVNSKGRISDDDYIKEVGRIEKEEKKYKNQIDSLQKRKTDLQILLGEVENNEKFVDPKYILKITDHEQQKEIVDDVIELITVERTEKGQIIKVYSRWESDPHVYINKTRTNHTVILREYPETGVTIDISGEYRPRYSRTNK